MALSPHFSSPACEETSLSVRGTSECILGPGLLWMTRQETLPPLPLSTCTSSRSNDLRFPFHPLPQAYPDTKQPARGPRAPFICRLLLFSGSVVSSSLRPHGLQHARLPCPHGLQHARLPCPSLSPRACSDSRPWRQ